jgi:hypothetical protein
MQAMNLVFPLADVSESPDHDNIFCEVYVKYYQSADSYDNGAFMLYSLELTHSDTPLHDSAEAEVLAYAERLWEKRV